MLFKITEFDAVLGGIVGGSGGTGGSIARDMYFASVSERDTFTTDNPGRLTQGVACAVGPTGPNYDYYQWDEPGDKWRAANLIYQGRPGDAGEKGDTGDTGDTVK